MWLGGEDGIGEGECGVGGVNAVEISAGLVVRQEFGEDRPHPFDGVGGVWQRGEPAFQASGDQGP